MPREVAAVQVMPLVDNQEYRLTPLSDLTYKLRGAGELFSCVSTRFSAGWDGRPDSGRGMLLNLGTLDFRPLDTASFHAEVSECYLGVPVPPVGKNDFHDSKHDSTGTGGGERRYVDALFARAAILHEEQAKFALLAWNLEQFARPRSVVPWVYDDGGKFAGRSHGKQLAGWNAGDPAHASWTQDHSLALLGSPLGLMNVFMALRFLFNDSFRGNPLDQPRCAWLLRWSKWAIELRLHEMEQPLLDAFFQWPEGDPATHAPFAADLMTIPNALLRWDEWLIRSWVEQWDDNYPEVKTGKTDGKVFPQLKGTPHFAGYYCWQFGLALYCFARNGDPRLGELADKLARPLVDFFRGDGSVTWPYSRGTHPFDTAGEIEELFKLCPVADQPNLAVHPLGGKFHAVKSWKGYGDEMVALIAPGLLKELGPGHAVIRNIVQHRKRDAHWEYMSPFWRVV